MTEQPNKGTQEVPTQSSADTQSEHGNPLSNPLANWIAQETLERLTIRLARHLEALKAQEGSNDG